MNRVREVLDIVSRADALGQYDHNLLGMAGVIIAEEDFGMERAPAGAWGIDGFWFRDGERRRVQVKAWSQNRIAHYGEDAKFRITPGKTDDLLVLLIDAGGYKVLYSGSADDVGRLGSVKRVKYRFIEYDDFK